MRALDLTANVEGVDVLRVDDHRAFAQLASESREHVAAARAPVRRLAEVPVDDGEHRPARVAVVLEERERPRGAACGKWVKSLAGKVVLELVEGLGVVLENEHLRV